MRDIYHFSLQIHEATNSNKECLLITYVRFIDGDEMREELLFCKQVPGRATAEELFKIIDKHDIEMGGLCGVLHRQGTGYGWEMRRAASVSPPLCRGRTA